MPRFASLGTLIFCSILVTPVFASNPTIAPAYNGGFKDDFPSVLQRVQTMVPNAQHEVVAALGIVQPATVFTHPVSVRFADGVPSTNENNFFYVETVPSDDVFSQRLMVNVEAIVRFSRQTQHDDVAIHNSLNYAMTQLILNDATRGNADVELPEWFQEGLGVYTSGSIPYLVKRVAGNVTRSDAAQLVEPLNRPKPFMNDHQYALYGLAVQYIATAYGNDGLQQITREILGGKSAADAILNDLNLSWADFERKAGDYTREAFVNVALPDDPNRTADTKRNLPTSNH